MELHSGPKMANGTCGKMIVAGTIDRGSTVLAFRGKDLVNNKLLERINSLIYLIYSLSFTRDIDIPTKITKFIQTLGIVKSVMKPSLVQKQMRIKIYKTFALSVLDYGCEAWTISKSGETRITAAESQFMMHTVGFTQWDHKRNEIMEEIRTELV